MKPSDSSNQVNTNELDFSELANAIQLREGVDGITRALWILYSQSVASTREWSRMLHIPVPVLAALRRELEKLAVVKSEGKLELSEEGYQLLSEKFGGAKKPKNQCLVCGGSGRIFPPEAMEILDEFREICEKRPDVDVTLDQSHATPETGIRKALLLLEMGLLNRSIVFLGDDDFISIACLLVRRRFMNKESIDEPLYVLDVDTRYLDMIREISKKEIQVQPYDVREELPDALQGKFGVAVTDPAYTNNAVIAFAYRCLCAVQNTGAFFLSMPMQDAETMGNIQSNLVEMGWVVREIYPQFNEYWGASIHAHVSSLFVWEKWLSIPPDKFKELRYTPFYTGELRSPGGLYECTACESSIQVGVNQEYSTVSELKKKGCPECGNTKFRRIGKIEE